MMTEISIGRTVEERVTDLEKSFGIIKSKLDCTTRKLSKTERRLEISRKCNEELRIQVDRLGAKLHRFRQHHRKSRPVNAASQTDGQFGGTTASCLESTSDALQPRVTARGVCCMPVTESLSTLVCGTENEQSLKQGLADHQPLSLVEDLRCAAEEAVRQSGFVYDDASGYYYDQVTGLYYHAESQLYYDQSNSAYYFFDQKAQKYVFHSQLDMPQSELSSGGSAKDVNVTSRRLPKTTAALKQRHATTRAQCLEPGSVVDLTTGSNKSHSSTDSDKEDGELSESEDEDLSRASFMSLPHPQSKDDAAYYREPSGGAGATVLAGWPPCIRAIVLRSATMKAGSLHIITYPGGSVGQGKDSGHVLVLPDVAVSKVHARIIYDHAEKGFYVQDCDSTNGTYVNNHRLVPYSEVSTETAAVSAVSAASDVGTAGSSLDTADPPASASHAAPSGPILVGAGSRCSLAKQRLSHRDVVRFATCELLFHIHPSNDTCDDCEPGVIQARQCAANDGCDLGQQATSEALTAALPAASAAALGTSKTSIEGRRRMLMKRIKQKYGLEKEAFHQPKAKGARQSDYTDRAMLRRRLVGSDNPHVLDTEPVASSVDRPISPENKGHKMLQKMGWKSGDVLGRGAGSGIAEPVRASIRLNATAGLGAESAAHVSLDHGGGVRALSSKAHVRLKTQERFAQIK